ncbi:endonuclease/exonuclease/phosphatase family protein [Variovorax sp. dw_308]|uniref:endonuclease/exonuclease/phosphatase family protein n=1 Tax=Variovorax sp. dw_308 TaxID=2721546 RepID=UPI001C455D9D|nr:endonuclease/exonuclease/phosphatase family protein [Variovorax sp. dw_308]
MKLITWNTQWCRGLDGDVSPRRIVEGARAMADFDVLCLQEIAQGFDGMPGAPGDQPAELAALLPCFQLFFGAAVDEFDAAGKRQRFGNLVATRLPVENVQHHPLPWPADPSVSSMPRMCTVVTVRDPVLGPVRVMTTHLEYYSQAQRMAQVDAVRELNAQACAQAAAPPKSELEISPFQAKAHTPRAILCGDFNLVVTQPGHPVTEPEYQALHQPHPHGRLQDAWPLVHGAAPHAPTFRLFDRRYGPTPATFDFVFVTDDLSAHVRRMEVDILTRASDHQPVLVEL